MSHAPVLYSQVLHIQRHCDGLLAFQQHQKSTVIQESVTLMVDFKDGSLVNLQSFFKS